MGKWKKAKLGDIAQVSAGQCAPQGKDKYCDNGIPFVKAGNLEVLVNGYSEYDIQKVNLEVAKSHKLKLFSAGTIVFAKSGMSCMKGFVYILRNDCYVVNHLACVKPVNINIGFLKYCFLFHKPNNLIKDSAYPSISLSDISTIQIPLPPPETQKQIANILDTTAEMLALRKQQLAELDNLIKSIFYDMFGDPAVNEKRWETTILSNCLDRIESGWSPKCKERPVDGEEWGICKLSAVTGGYYKETENKAIFEYTKVNLDLAVKTGDLLFSRKNTIELVGSCAYVFKNTKKVMIPDTIFRLCTKDNIHKLYLWGLLNCQTFKIYVQKLASGTSGSMPNISKERLKGLKIPLPSLTQQSQFAQIVTKIEEQKAIVKKAIDETQYLFECLMSQYFD